MRSQESAALLKTRRQTNTDMAAELLARAIESGAAGAALMPQTAPDESGAVFLPTEIRSATGQRLPSIENALRRRLELQQSESPLGRLAMSTAISLPTGCWLAPEIWRDDKGYGYVRDSLAYGLKSDSRFGTRIHKLAFILFKRETEPDFELPARTPIDHVCRFTGCCNPLHLAATTAMENNRLQRAAHPVEAALSASSAFFGPTGFEWLDEVVSESDTEDTGLVVSTRHGPYRVIKDNESPLLIRGEAEPSQAIARLRRPSVRSTTRPSRARQPRPLEGQ